MKTDIKKMNLLAPKWWNPLFWVVVVLAPVLGIAIGAVYGVFCGMIMGYGKGLSMATRKMDKFLATLP